MEPRRTLDRATDTTKGRTVLLLVEGEELAAAEATLAAAGHRLVRLPLAHPALEEALHGPCDLLVADARLLGRRGVGSTVAQAHLRAPLLLLSDRPREEAELLSARSGNQLRYAARSRDGAALAEVVEQLLRAPAAPVAEEPAQTLQEAHEARLRAELARGEAEEVTRLKDEFIATFSHELRTPLTSILGWARMLRLGRASSDPTGPAISAIERNARLMAGLIEDLLDLHRAASGRLTVRFRELELNQLVESAVASAQPEADQKQQRLVFARPAEQLSVFGDRGRLTQVVSSLLVNAIKFTPANPRIDVALAAAEADVLLTVQDSGMGIAPEFMRHLFEPFRQEDSSLSRSQGGLGLGLALVRELVEAHGGTASAESAGRGQGSVFTIALPLRARGPRTRPPPPIASPAPPPEATLFGARLLLVEDDDDARFLIASMLEQAGAKVATAASAAEGFALVQASDLDLLISDVSMPGEDGYSLIRRVRAGARNQAVPALALTANARSEDRDRAIAAGFELHLAKPVEPDTLVRELSLLLGRFRAQVV